MRSRIFTYDLLKIVSRPWSNAGLEERTASSGRVTNTGYSGWSRLCDNGKGKRENGKTGKRVNAKTG